MKRSSKIPSHTTLNYEIKINLRSLRLQSALLKRNSVKGQIAIIMILFDFDLFSLNAVATVAFRPFPECIIIASPFYTSEL